MVAEIAAAVIAIVAMIWVNAVRKRQAEIVEIFRRLNKTEQDLARLEGSVRLLRDRP